MVLTIPMTSLYSVPNTLAFALACAVAAGQVGGYQVPHEDTLTETRSNLVEQSGHRTQSVRVEVGDSGEVTCDDVGQGRNVADYERLGPLEGGTLLGRDASEAVRKARAFVWEHWHARRRGYLIITFWSVDERSTSHVFIEPNGSGEWRVAWRIVRVSGSVDDGPYMYSLRRVVLLPSGKTGEELSDGVEVDASQYELMLFESNGTLGHSL